jgi:hypothetical protein
MYADIGPRYGIYNKLILIAFIALFGDRSSARGVAVGVWSKDHQSVGDMRACTITAATVAEMAV